MARFSSVNVNPDLVSERTNATFQVEKLIHILDGSEQATRRRHEIEIRALSDKYIQNETSYHYKSRSEKYNDAVEKSAFYVRLRNELAITDRTENWYLLNILFPNETTPIGLSISMFPTTLENLGTLEQVARWLPKTRNFEIVGTYAQTELGHGTHIRNLETTSTYDPKTEEFVINSPTLTSMKFWPGGLGKTTNHAVVMAMLYSGGVNHGLHPFVVQTRDMKTHEPLPGVTLGDIGPKFGYDTMDNGFLRFNHYRIPRENLLMKYQEVTKDGRYIKKATHDKILYGAMLETRVNIVTDPAAKGLMQAITIAVRYSCVRRQSELKPGNAEPKIMEYQTQQYKLLPLLATAYVYAFAGKRLKNEFNRLNILIQNGQVNALPELHALSAGLKAVTSFGAMCGIEQCRLACGGHGYSQSSGIPKIYCHTIPSCTYEGENTVLLLQTARYLVKMCSKPDSSSRSTAYLLKRTDVSKSDIGTSLNVQSLVDAFKHRAARLVIRVSERLVRLQAEGQQPYEAWNKSSVLLVKAAQAHIQYNLVETFLESIRTVADISLSAVLTELLQLYACYEIYNSSGDFTEDGYISAQQVDIISDGVLILLARIRPNAVTLVDSFDFTDRHLGSVLGRYDGNVYENLYKWACESPLNKTQVHPSFEYLKGLTQAKL